MMTNYSRVRSTLTLVGFFIALVVWASVDLQTNARSYVETEPAHRRNVESKDLANSSRLLMAAYAPPPPSFNGYTYQRTLTVDHNKVANTDQSNFPVLISGTYFYLATVANGGNVQNATGYDVIFTSDSGCTSKLDHEVETYNSTTGSVSYWVKVPTLSHTSDTVIYMCYGNSSITTDQSNKTGVWDSNYKGVWHLPNGSSLTANDSTSNANNGTIGGAVAGAAKIEGGGSFNGSSTYIDVKAGKVDSSTTTGTVSAWVKISALNTNGAVLGYGGYGPTAPAFWGVYTREVSGNRYFAVAGRATEGATFNTVRGSTVVAANTWYYVTYSSNGSTWKIRLNGAATETVTAVLGTNTGQWIGDIVPSTPDKSVIGAVYAGGGYSSVNFWHGLLDEVRLSNIERSDDWVATEYNNQNSPATFYTISTATSGTYSYKRTLTIDHNKVPNTDQNNFPVLISGTYSYLATVANGGNVQNANGYDVIFTSDSGCTTKLNHEVETYNPATGAVNYWVKVPTVSHTNDTVIYMCYGNSSITADQSTKSGVWDSNYKGVWHLPNGSSLTANDSTSNANNGTITGAVADAAKIEGGGSFNGSSTYIDVKAGKVDSSTTTGSVSAWVKISALDTNGAVLGYGGATAPAQAFWGVYTREVSGNRYFAVAGRATDGATFNTVRGSTVLTANTWYYVTYSSNGATWRIRLNGAAAETVTAVLGTNTGQWIGDITPTTPDKSTIGAVYTGGGNYSPYNFWHGLLDEVRLSNIERSDDWVATEYNNQNSPATFYTISAATSAYPPTVSITSPTSGAIIPAPALITITADAADQDGTISKVEFFKDGVEIGEDTSSPFSFAWNNIPAGSYSLTAVATDNANATGTSAAVSILVNAAPAVSITSPANNATLPAASTVTINATANDSDGTVSKVEFFKDGVEIGEDTSSPFSFAWNNVPAGSYSLTAVATDNTNATTTSAAVSIVVNAAPAVSITSPTNNATFTGSMVTINATASDSDGGVSKVEFFRNGVEIGEDLSAPYSFAWTSLPQGTSTLTAVATDGHGATTTSTTVQIHVVDFNLARLDPDNRTGGSGEDPLSRNFSWSLPLVGLPGRAGLNLGLSLSYNSLIWTKSGSYISFNADAGFTPGFRLGFPVIQTAYYNQQVGKNAFILISPDGSRTELRQVGSSNLYESGDSSYLQLDSSTMILRTTDGTQLSYGWQGSDYQCTQIKDRNGNFISINYTAFGRIDNVIDTLNRTVKFNYDGANLLSSITQTWTVNGASQTHTWAAFTYSDLSISTNFTGLTNLGPQNGATIKVLTRVTTSDNSRFDFDYTSWGQVWKISNYAADGTTLLNYRSYNLPLNNATAQTDCPRFTGRRDWAQNWNRSGAAGASGLPAGPEDEVLTSFSEPSNASWTLPDGTQQTGFVAQVTLPDFTYNKIYFPASIDSQPRDWHRGYPSLVETYDSGHTRQRQSVTKWKQDNESVSYSLNPRVTETNVYDPAGNRKRTTVDYGPAEKGYEQWGLPYLTKEYAADGTTEIRHTFTDYNLSQAYLDRRIIGLVSSRSVSDTLTWQSIIAFSYDAGGSQLVNTPATTIQHDPTYGTNLTTGRGNVTAVTRYDVFDIEDASKRSVTQVGYNTNGSVVFSRDPAGHENSVSYDDSFSADGVSLDAPRSFATFAYPTTMTDADGYTSSVHYNYQFGATTWRETPLPNTTTDTPGPQQRIIYDSIGRIQKVTQLSNGAYTRYVYSNSHNRLDTYATVIDGASEQNGNEAHSFQILDGHGRVVANASAHPGSVGGFSGQLTLFDIMGRAIKSSNPTETNASGAHPGWPATGDDASTGWVYTQQTYDWKGRPRVTTNTNSTTKEATYGGCGCAGGEVVTLTDEVGRRQKIYSDVLGRNSKTEILNSDGSVYSTTMTTFNARDQVTLARNFQGASPSDPNDLSCPTGTCQQVVMTYDGCGRLSSQHRPEQSPGTATTYVYNSDDTVLSVTDARGATQTFSYNQRHLVTGIAYSAPYGISPTPNVSFTYDGTGNRTSMIDGLGIASYSYDQLSRLAVESRYLNELGNSYAINYGYNLSGALTGLTDPSGYQVSYTHDSAGRVTSVSSPGFQGATDSMAAITYRAFGEMKHATFSWNGNSHSMAYSYDRRLEVTRYELLNPMTGMHGSEYQRDADSRVRYARDLADPQFDRAYSYDQVGRVKEALSGAEARSAGPADGPYKQNYAYDVWDNMTNRTGRHWTKNVPALSGTFVNNRNTQWQYDAEGNLLNDTTRSYSYDTAGRMVQSQPIGSGASIAQVFDGDGLRGKHFSGVARYELRSRLLSGQVVSNLTQQGQKESGVIYANGRRVAKVVVNEIGNYVFWEHRTPTNGTILSGSYGSVVSRDKELDPLGDSVGIENPYLPGGSGDGGADYPAFGSAASFSGGCSFEGGPIDCNMVMKWFYRNPIRGFYTLMNARVGIRQPRNIYANIHGGNSVLVSRTLGTATEGGGGAQVTVTHAPAQIQTQTVGSQMAWLSLRQTTLGFNPQEPAKPSHSRDTRTDCERFADIVDELWKASQSQSPESVQTLMDRMALRFTELSGANYVALAAATTNFGNNENFNGLEFGSSGFATPFYEPPRGNNQVRHTVAALIQGYVRGESAALRAMNQRENPRDPLHGMPDINLNNVAVPMGAKLAGDNGMKLARNLGQWIRGNLCAK